MSIIKFYVYLYLDPRKPGKYIFSSYIFEYEPFYVGKGKKDRAYLHLKENRQNPHFNRKIKKIQQETGNNPIIIKYQENLLECNALKLETDMISAIGRHNLNKGPLCNLTNGGEGISGYKWTIEQKEILKKASPHNPAWNKGSFGYKKMKKYSNDIINKAILLRSDGMGFGKISELMNIPQTNIKRWYKEKFIEL